MTIPAQNPQTRLANSRKRVVELIAWLESGVQPTPSELADYAKRLADYGKSGPQAGLPFKVGG